MSPRADAEHSPGVWRTLWNEETLSSARTCLGQAESYSLAAFCRIL